ncbi:MAG: hypothetical protein JKX88_00010 [Marinicaulis sp.]|nr:hypothetical protein [Marinicaulis sp.]
MKAYIVLIQGGPGTPHTGSRQTWAILAEDTSHARTGVINASEVVAEPKVVTVAELHDEARVYLGLEPDQPQLWI